MNARREALYSGIEDLRQRAGLFAAKVHPLYVISGWTWTGSETPPTPKKIEATLGGLLDILYDAVGNGELDEQNAYRSCTGGLEVGYVGGGQFVMAFSLEEWVERNDWALTHAEETDD